jgi:hypothetical protein
MHLLTYTPRQERTKAPDYVTGPFVPRSYHADCGWNWDNVYTGDGVPEACISVNAAEDDDYADDSWESFITHIEFAPNRKSFRSAWRIARMLNRGNGHVLLSFAEWQALHGPITIFLGKRHKLEICMTHFVPDHYRIPA